MTRNIGICSGVPPTYIIFSMAGMPLAFIPCGG